MGLGFRYEQKLLSPFLEERGISARIGWPAIDTSALPTFAQKHFCHVMLWRHSRCDRKLSF